MFVVTSALRQYAARSLGLPLGATDSEIRRALTKALNSGKITPRQCEALCTPEESKAPKKKPASKPAPKKDDAKKKPAKDGKKPAKAFTAEEVESIAEGAVRRAMGGGATKSVASLYRYDIRVKSAAESYSASREKAICPSHTGISTKSTPHPRAGRPALAMDGRELYHPSQLDKAISAAYLKFAIQSSTPAHLIPRGLKMTDHEMDLMNHAMHHMEWTGILNGEGVDTGGTKVHNKKLSDLERKMLLDDSTSGGLEATPIVFDDAVILTPVLHSELFNLVNVVNVARGRRMEGFSMGNPTFTSGTAEGTAITPFTTTSFIAAFDTTIFPSVASMEIGLDFEEDSPNDIGGLVQQQFGLKALEYLDRVVAVGNGTTEPEGVFNASSVTTISSDNGPGGPPTIGDYEGMMFGVAKAFRKEPGAQNIFLGNETSYRRARAIPVGPYDERRVFGMTHADYMLLDTPYKIQVDVDNNQLAYFNAKRYRMYRRLGLNVKIETAGNYLASRNLKLIVLRQRYGGRLEIGGAACIISDAQA